MTVMIQSKWEKYFLKMRFGMGLTLVVMRVAMSSRLFSKAQGTIDCAVHYFVQPSIEIAEDGQTATASWYLWQPYTCLL